MANVTFIFDVSEFNPSSEQKKYWKTVKYDRVSVPRWEKGTFCIN